MKVDTMRRIDHLLGVPLCAFFTPFAFVRNLFASKQKPRRILFIELSEMGSAILADPAMRHTKKTHNAELFFVIFKKNKPSLDLLKTVPNDNIFCVDESSLWHLACDMLRFMIWCRKKKIDTSVDLELFSRCTALLGLFSGAQARVGFGSGYDEGLWRGKLLTKEVYYNPHQHISIGFLSLVRSLGESFHGIYPNTKITLPELTTAQVDEKEVVSFYEQYTNNYPALHNKRWVIFNSYSSELLPQRCWPQDYFVQVAYRLLKQFDDIVIVFTGTHYEQNYISAMVEQIDIPQGVVNLTGKTSFAQLILLYHNACLMLSSDSGPPHFAATTGLKTFVLFGPETPCLYKPLGNTEVLYLGLACSPCVKANNHRKTSCTDNKCMTELLPDTVYATVADYLQNTPTKHTPCQSE